MKYEIVELEKKVVQGIKIKTTNQDGKAMDGDKWLLIIKKNISKYKIVI